MAVLRIFSDYKVFVRCDMLAITKGCGTYLIVATSYGKYSLVTVGFIDKDSKKCTATLYSLLRNSILVYMCMFAICLVVCK